MTKPINGDHAKPEKLMQIKGDGGSPRLAVFVWLENGECHQVMLKMKQRTEVLKMIHRMHDFTLQVAAGTIGLRWKGGGEDKEQEKAE